MKGCLYKFRKIDKHAIDILVNHRLYLSSWELLNDPHEAVIQFIKTSLPMEINFCMNPKKIKKFGIPVESPDVRVCALSETWESNLAWSHYAGGQFGISIGLQIPKKINGLEIIRVVYDDQIPKVIGRESVDKNTVIQALSHKAREWSYEKEVRFLSFDSTTKYLDNIIINEVIFGLRCTDDDVNLVKKILKRDSCLFFKIKRKPGSYRLDRRKIEV